MGMNSTVLAIIGLVVVPLLTAECGEVAPWLAAKILRWSARRLGDREKEERYTEEWLANLEHVPGKLTKLGHALGVAVLGVVQLRTRAPRLDWEPRPIVTPFETDSLFGQGSGPIAAKRASWRTTVQPLTYRPVDKDLLYPSRWTSAVIDWWPEPKPRRRRRFEPPGAAAGVGTRRRFGHLEAIGSGQWFGDDVAGSGAAPPRRREPVEQPVITERLTINGQEYHLPRAAIGD